MNAFSSMIAQAIASPAATHTAAVASAPAVKQAPKGKAKPIQATAEPVKKTPATVSKAQAAARVAIPYGIHDGYRPVAGSRLFAFSHAWLSLSGMAEGKAYSKAQAIKVAGATAIAYHKNAGRFVERDGMLSLSDAGQMFFGNMRRNSPEMVAKWVEILKTGKPDGEFVKSADMVRKIEA